MNKLYHFFGALDARNLFVLATLVCLLFAACAKSEIAQDDSIMNPAQAAAAGDGQNDPGSADPGNAADPSQGDPTDPSGQADQPVVPDDPYPHIPIESLDMMTVSCNADSDDAVPRAQSRASAGGQKPDELAPDFVPVDDDEDTRTYLDENRKIFWNQGDRVKIYYDNGASNFTTSLIKHGDTQTSTFDALVDKKKEYYYAFYPYDVTATMTNIAGTGAFEVVIPAVQDGKFENCHMAIAKASATHPTFSFYNVASYMKITVNNLTATAITLQASDEDDDIVGTVVAPFTDAAGTVGSLTVKSGTGSSSVRVNLPSGRTAATTVYVALVPGVNFSNGFRIRYEYGDSKDHPGFAYVKRTAGGERTSRSVLRKKILDIGTLDDRIIEDYFVKTSGSCSDADVAGAGNSWGNALNATGFADLISQPVDGGGSQINDDAFDKAWRLDGATIHVTGGSYTLSNVRMACTDYDHPFKVSIKGGYPSTASGTSTSASRDTTTNRTTFAGSGSARILTLGNQASLQMDKVWITGGRSAASGECGVGLLVAPNASSSASAHLTACGFKDNVCAHTSANGGAVALSGDTAWARFDGCHFYSNGTGNEQSAGAIYVWSSSRLAELHVNGCTFVNNWTGYWGGAIGCSAGKVYINQEDNTVATTFTANHVTNASSSGGALSVNSNSTPASTVTAQNCDFIGNYSPGSNSGEYGQGGAISIDGYVNASFDYIRCNKHPSITRNLARNGAYLSLSTPGGYTVSFDHSSFNDGQVLNVGGCMVFPNDTYVCPAEFKRCSFTGNHSSWCGGVCHINKPNHSVSFENCEFTSNYMTGDGGGGVLSMENGTATFTACIFKGNQQRSTSGMGGGVFWLVSNSTNRLTVKGCTFTDDDSGNHNAALTTSASHGGGVLFLQRGAVTFTSSDGTSTGTRTTISGSYAASFGGAICTNNNETDKGRTDLTINLAYTDISGCSVPNTKKGGAIYTDAPITMNSCTVNGNSAGNGGAIYAQLKRYDSIAAGTGDCTITNTQINNNQATGSNSKGGAIYWDCASWDNDLGSPKLAISGSSTLSGNKAHKAGSALYCGKGYVKMDGVTVSGNQHYSQSAYMGDDAGGALYIYGTDNDTPSSGTFVAASKLDLDNCTVSNNTSTGKGGAVNVFSGRAYITNCQINNNSAYTRGGAISQIWPGFILVRRSSLKGNYLTSSDRWGNVLHVSNGGPYSMFVNCTLDDGDTKRDRPIINGSPKLMMVNCTVIGNTTEATIRVENGHNGLLLNNIILNKGGGASLYGNGNYYWSSYSGYNIFGTVSYNSGVTSYYTTKTTDQTGKTTGDLGNWQWNSNGYYTWNGKVGETATATPAINTTTKADDVSTGMINGYYFGTKETYTDGDQFSYEVTSLGNQYVTWWGGSDYWKDQRYSGNRTVSGKNYPGAYCP